MARNDIDRRSFLRAAGAAGVVATCGETPDPTDPGRTGLAPPSPSESPPDPDSNPPTDTDLPPASKPHIVLIYADQLRGDAIAAAGNPVVISPHLDALAGDGVLFDHCFSNANSCRPARTTLFTGQYVHQHGVQDNNLVLDPTSRSHVRRMRDEAGYFTMVVGKTHLADVDTHISDNKPVLEQWGFVDSVELRDPMSMAFGKESAHSDYLTATTPAGEPDKWLRAQQYVQGYELLGPPPDADPTRLDSVDHLDFFCARTACDFIKAYDDERPLYLQLCFPGPHKPFDSTTEYRERYDRDDPDMPEAILEVPQAPVAPLVQQYLALNQGQWTEQTARQLRVEYYAKITMVDEGIGMVIGALRDAGLYDNTWIIVCSDHGELLADHMLTGKVVAYEAAIHVPLVIRPAGGLTSGWTDTGIVDTMDLVATLLSLAGLDPNDYGDRDLTARVLGGATGPDAHAPKDLLFENLLTPGIRTIDAKMTWDLALGVPVEFYDLVADPEERVNRVQDPDAIDAIDALVQILRSRRGVTVDNWTSGRELGRPHPHQTIGPGWSSKARR